MGKVVKLEASATDRKPARSSAAVKRRRRRSKSALVLGGGGFTGGVYEIGALRALNLLSVNRTVNEFDVYVGTSAGAFVAAAVANGVTPEEMMRVIVEPGRDAVSRRARELVAAAQLQGVSDPWGEVPAAAGAAAAPARARLRPGVGGRPRARSRRGAPVRAVLGRGARALRPPDPVRGGSHR